MDTDWILIWGLESVLNTSHVNIEFLQHFEVGTIIVPKLQMRALKKMEVETNLPKVTASKRSIKFKPRLHCPHQDTALYLPIYAQMLTCRYANKCCAWGGTCLNTWLPMQQRFSSFKWFKISLHVLETRCFHRISPTAEDQVEYETEYELHRMNSLSTVSICKQRMHLFHMSENRLSFLGGYPDVV